MLKNNYIEVKELAPVVFQEMNPMIMITLLEN